MIDFHNKETKKTHTHNSIHSTFPIQAGGIDIEVNRYEMEMDQR